MLTFMDQFVDDLLTKERVCGTSLRKLPARSLLEDLGQLDERVSPMGEEIEAIDRQSEMGGESEGEEVEEVGATVNGNGIKHEDSD